MKAMTVYSDDPVRVAADWESRGARWLHLVDLDRATGAQGDNRDVMEKVISASTIPVEVGGGIRSPEDLRRWTDAGAERICIGTRSLDPPFLEEAIAQAGDRLVVSLDARGDEVQVEGWQRGSGISKRELIGRAAGLGVKRIMYTDIARDGTLSGPNVGGLEEVLDQAGGRMGVIASGGVKETADVQALAALASRGLEGVVVGRALYSGTLSLEDALAAAGSAAGLSSS
jgi:phosphoribosylformimino-5-aminoimidazole carboxamide ribotide isomerase